MEKFINNFSHFFNIYKPILDNPQPKNPENYEEKCKTHVSIYSGTTDFFKSDCIKCMKYLKYLDDYDDLGYQKQGIVYLYLWLQYYEKKNNIDNVKTLDSINTLMESYEKISTNVPNIQNIYNNDIKNKLNDKLNDLYYLYYKFNKFKKNESCTDTKCTCAKECVDTYIMSIKKCDSDGNEYLCNELEKFREQYNTYMSSVEACPGVQSYLPSCKKYSTSVIILFSFITISVLSSLLFILYKVITIFIYLFIVQ
ncbi:hypothetical protein PVBG_06020 [Plasmodium vivax Brazil I]|uniref:Uncharacterized protein n=1 Tax=Plasmodium vivax (strain Brazil I) TaxID=1033975 RepID=A0A0J9VNB9_PLAV1|nr:hypothetical protein PVBG_06020 [Plasmodium vivax Brazil I]